MIDVWIVAGFVIYSVTTGFLLQKKASRGLDDYFLAGRTLKGWQAGFSMAATQYAADTPLLVTGLIATAGIFSLWRLWIYALAFLLMGFVLGASWRRARVLTDAEFTELRYSGRGASALRFLKAFYMGTLVNCTVLAMVLLAATRIAEPFLLWHEWLPASWTAPLAAWLENQNFILTALPPTHPEVWIRSADNLISIAAIVGFVTLYSTTGGLRSVVATDVVQFSLAMIATLIYAVVVVGKAGGFGLLQEKLSLLYGEGARLATLSFGPPDFSQASLVFLAVLAVQWFAQVNADGTGYLAQRTMACATDRGAKEAAVVFTVGQILFRSLLWLPIGLALLVLYPEPALTEGVTEALRLGREGTFVTGIRDFLPAGVRGLMLTGMLAALASTVDTHLNWGASYWANDLYKAGIMERLLKRKPGARELVWAARASNLGILAIALWIMTHLGSIQTAWHLSLLFGSGVGLVLILRWLWSRINLWSEVAAIVASLVLAFPLLFYGSELNEGVRLLLLVAGSTAVVAAVTLLTPAEPQETLVRFYERVRPSGFWAGVAREAGDLTEDPRKRLARSLAAAFLAAISIFLVLFGCGNLLIQGFQGNGTSWGALGAGIFLVPVWWRLGMK